MVLVDQLISGRERFLGYVRARVSEPALAEDILQDSLLKALKAAPEIRDQDLLVPWFYRVLRNAIVDSYRRKASGASLTQLEDALDVPEDIPQSADLCECFRPLLQTINSDYAQLIEAELVDEPPSSETLARDLGISMNNLKVRRHRARQALRRRLEETCRTCADHGCLDCACA